MTSEDIFYSFFHNVWTTRNFFSILRYTETLSETIYSQMLVTRFKFLLTALCMFWITVNQCVDTTIKSKIHFVLWLKASTCSRTSSLLSGLTGHYFCSIKCIHKAILWKNLQNTFLAISYILWKLYNWIYINENLLLTLFNVTLNIKIFFQKIVHKIINPEEYHKISPEIFF